MDDFFHEGNRELQDEFDSRRLADRAIEIGVHSELTGDECKFIESRDMFFISTVDEQGRPTVSYKGGGDGFIRVLDNKIIAYPGYDGNGMFLTTGNALSNNNVGILLIDFENPHRMRIHGTATRNRDDPLLQEYPESKYIVRVSIRNIFSNCSRYIHKYKKIEQSEFVPLEGVKAPDPEWKSWDVVQDVLPKNV